MKASLFLAATSAVLAMAKPVFQKRALETETVTELTYVTVTEDEPLATNAAFFKGGQQFKERPVTTTEAPPPPPPPPAATPTPVVDIPAPPPPEPTPEPAPPAPEPVAPPPVVEDKPAPPPVVEQVNPPQGGNLADIGVYHHNIHRVNHSAPALSWSDSLASYAAQAAGRCVFEHDTKPGGGGYGQNLAMYGSSDTVESEGGGKSLADAITGMWYNGEAWQFPGYGSATPDMSAFDKWGHFSQVIWAGTKEVGCHVQYCEKGTMFASMAAWYTVCNYAPAGNVGSQYAKNVLPPLNRATVTT
jgi:uncharacterized protein YkwD